MTEFAVISTTFRNTPLKSLLENCGIKVQDSEKTEKNSIIFPFNVAFLVYEAKSLLSDNNLDEKIISSIVRFRSLNKNSNLIIIGTLKSFQEISTYTKIQKRLRNLNSFVNVSVDYFDCAQIIQEVFKLNSPNVRQSIIDVLPNSTGLTLEEQKNLKTIAEKLRIEV